MTIINNKHRIGFFSLFYLISALGFRCARARTAPVCSCVQPPRLKARCIGCSHKPLMPLKGHALPYDNTQDNALRGMFFFRDCLLLKALGGTQEYDISVDFGNIPSRSIDLDAPLGARSLSVAQTSLLFYLVSVRRGVTSWVLHGGASIRYENVAYCS